jgi:hypothetical protein
MSPAFNGWHVPERFASRHRRVEMSNLITPARSGPPSAAGRPSPGPSARSAGAARRLRHKRQTAPSTPSQPFRPTDSAPSYKSRLWLSLDEVATAPSKRDAPRVPFGSLVERGVVPPGMRLMDWLRRVVTTVAAHGTIIACNARTNPPRRCGGAEHALCKGWLFWHIERGGGLVPLDRLRGDAVE